MTPMLQVVSCHPGASVQDLGRGGFRRFGVASAGAMDQGALARANLLAGNPPGAAAIELALAGARLRVKGGAIGIAVAGPGVGLAIEGRRCDPDASAIAPEGCEITITPGREGVYAYLAVAGGITTPAVLGSRSLHLRSGIGGRPLHPGDILPCAPGGLRPRRRLAPERPWPDGPVRVVAGPQADSFEPEVLARFMAAPWRIEPRFDRMALRLAGPPVPASGGHDIVSDGVIPGCIQIPGDGQPLVLLRDCQTTGGYPKIATVISADLDRLAQCRPGTLLRFRSVTPDQAREAARQRGARIEAMVATPVVDGTEHLLANNLIGGVTDGNDCGES